MLGVVTVLFVALILVYLFWGNQWIPGYGTGWGWPKRRIDPEMWNLFTADELKRMTAIETKKYPLFAFRWMPMCREVQLYKFYLDGKDVTGKVVVILGQSMNAQGELVFDTHVGTLAERSRLMNCAATSLCSKKSAD